MYRECGIPYSHGCERVTIYRLLSAIYGSKPTDISTIISVEIKHFYAKLFRLVA
jgi:hypothetical protein